MRDMYFYIIYEIYAHFFCYALGFHYLCSRICEIVAEVWWLFDKQV